MTQQQLKRIQKRKESRVPQTTQPQIQCVLCSKLFKANYIFSIFTCGHKQICLQCSHQYTLHCLNQQNIPKCLTSQCTGTLKHQDQRVMDQFTNGIKSKFKKQFELKQLKNNRVCSTPDCYGFINNGTCILCLTNFCQQCYNTQHLGKCQKIEDLPETIKCPSCGEGIERDGGCLHMKCIRPACKYEFCFYCLQKWSAKHHACGGVKSICEMIKGWIMQRF